jgi:hypothetical protein
MPSRKSFERAGTFCSDQVNWDCSFFLTDVIFLGLLIFLTDVDCLWHSMLTVKFVNALFVCPIDSNGHLHGQNSCGDATALCLAQF